MATLNVRMRTQVLAEHILRRGLSQNRFAIKAGVSSPYMAQLLAGKRKPSGEVRQKLLKATGLKFDDLFIIDCPAGNSTTSAVANSAFPSLEADSEASADYARS